MRSTKQIKLLGGYIVSSSRDVGAGAILVSFELLFVGYGRNVIAAARLCQVTMKETLQSETIDP
jgi:hypothetical protein